MIGEDERASAAYLAGYTDGNVSPRHFRDGDGFTIITSERKVALAIGRSLQRLGIAHREREERDPDAGNHRVWRFILGADGAGRFLAMVPFRHPVKRHKMALVVKYAPPPSPDPLPESDVTP